VTEAAGRAAVVTGGTRGIGLAIASELVSRGVDVVAAGRTSSGFDAARAAVGVVGARGRVAGEAARVGRFECVAMDVRDYAQVERALAEAADLVGGIDILVNNAGIGSFCEVASQPPEQWRELVETNLTGAFHCCRAAIPHLRRRGGGWIINISSLAGKNPFRGGAAYCASKAGLNAFSEALMQEVRYEDIRVSCILPGSVRTEFAGAHEGAGTEWKLEPGDVARVVADLLEHDPRSLPSHVEIRPSRPKR
jgi:NAD(P)-dependent dehydrogenase (short-subunit alcohol dehydrogenase family)